jgi:myo-inositol-1(or 4)-monophosphatase
MEINNNIDFDDILRHSVLAARESSKFLLENFHKCQPLLDISVKDDLSIVTELDRQSQNMIIAYLGKQFPKIGFIAEEQNQELNLQARDYSHYFVVDPLDGTQCFVDGIPFFSVSIALCDDNSKVLTGVVIDPNHGEEFTASIGESALLNGRIIRVSSQDRIEQMRINVNHNKLTTQLFDNINNNILRKIDVFHKLGSLCLEMAYVAAGRLDATINNQISMWDVCAASLIVEQAGGKWTLFDGSKPKFPRYNKFDIIASNNNHCTHDRLLDRITGAASVP